mmetsp:Transcript_14408/g.20026  ORF Transcript_14408/g.20026 Transcript_14408/m.20026 type:complete len:511 (-) Transcript_14408:835-2367(-)
MARGNRGRARGGGAGNGRGGRGINLAAQDNPSQDYDREDSKMTIPAVFDPDSFHNWRDDFTSFLDAKGCLGAIDHAANNWADMTPDKQQRIRARVWHYLKLSLTETYRYLTQEIDNNDPHALWHYVLQTYNITDERQQADLVRELEDFCWNEGDTVDAYLGRMMTIRSWYRQANLAHMLTERLSIFHVRNKLPPDYESLKPTIFANHLITWAEMRRLLKNAEKDLLAKKRKTTSLSLPGVQPQAFPHIKAKSEARSEGKKRRQFKKFLKLKKNSPSSSSKSDRCHFCGGAGYRRPQCKAKAWYRKHGFKGDQLHQVQKVGKSFVNVFDDSSSESDSVESYSEESDCEENAQISFHEAHPGCVEEESNVDNDASGFSFMPSTKLLNGKWLLDSASTHHITTTKEFLTDCIEARVRITTGTKGHPINATCRGVGQFRPIPSRKQLGTLTLHDVIYSSHASANLISIPKLDDAGCKTVVDNGVLTVYFDGKIVCQGAKEESGVYVLSLIILTL